jgi:hypothetical protein
MQHWHVYQKWNERLFREMLGAYRAGRSEGDPSDNWYVGELNFLDSYVIPLAQKIRDCGVFGALSDQCLSYAKKNREERERCGQGVVAQMIDRVGLKTY